MAFTFAQTHPYRYRPGMLFLGHDQVPQKIGIATERHALTIAGSGTGKGVALLIPNAMDWPNNLLVIDPKGEVASATWDRRQALGQQVAVLDPFSVSTVPPDVRATFNPLAEVEGDTPRGRAMLLAIGDGLVVSHDPRHMEWTEAARDILAGLAAYALADAPPEHRNFTALRGVLMQPKAALLIDAQKMAERSDYGGLIRNAGIMLMTACESERGLEKDALGLAQRATKWLDEPVIAETLAASTFKLSALKSGNLSVFLVLPADLISPFAGFLRLFVKTALLTMGREQSQGGKTCLFLLDEFYSLGKLSDVIEAAGRMRSYGVHLWPFVQSVGQITELYGQTGLETLISNSDAVTYFGINDPQTLAAIAERIGRYNVTDMDAPPVAPVMGTGAGGQIITAMGQGGKKSMQSSMAMMGGMVSMLSQASNAFKQSLYQDEMAKYQHQMARNGTYRVPPDVMAELIAKKNNDVVARSMIVFAKGNDVLNLGLLPYFWQIVEPPPPVPPKPTDWLGIAKLVHTGWIIYNIPLLIEAVFLINKQIPPLWFYNLPGVQLIRNYEQQEIAGLRLLYVLVFFATYILYKLFQFMRSKKAP
jgi:type IV secretion system protein VirD4